MPCPSEVFMVVGLNNSKKKKINPSFVPVCHKRYAELDFIHSFFLGIATEECE